MSCLSPPPNGNCSTYVFNFKLYDSVRVVAQVWTVALVGSDASIILRNVAYDVSVSRRLSLAPPTTQPHFNVSIYRYIYIYIYGHIYNIYIQEKQSKTVREKNPKKRRRYKQNIGFFLPHSTVHAEQQIEHMPSAKQLPALILPDAYDAQLCPRLLVQSRSLVQVAVVVVAARAASSWTVSLAVTSWPSLVSV